MKMNKYHFFLDESGDHGLTYIDPNFPLFLLAGCLFSDKQFQSISKEINTFKMSFFKTTSVVLHSRDIRKCDGAFQVLFDLEIKKSFYKRLNKIIQNSLFSIISVAIDKKKLIEKYGKGANNPYTICLSHILERLIFCTDNFNPSSQVEVYIEKRGKKEDMQLLAHYNKITDLGTYHVNSDRFKNRIVNFSMLLKRENNVGLQVSDLCAYPLARHVLNSSEPYIPYQIIENKLYKSGKGKIEGYGLKVFP